MDWTPALQQEFFALLDHLTTPMIEALQQRIRSGLINGSTFCCSEEHYGCLWGTAAWIHSGQQEAMVNSVYATDYLGYRFFLNNLETFVIWVRPGDTPTTSPALATLDAAIDDYLMPERFVAQVEAVR